MRVDLCRWRQRPRPRARPDLVSIRFHRWFRYLARCPFWQTQIAHQVSLLRTPPNQALLAHLLSTVPLWTFRSSNRNPIGPSLTRKSSQHSRRMPICIRCHRYRLLPPSHSPRMMTTRCLLGRHQCQSMPPHEATTDHCVSSRIYYSHIHTVSDGPSVQFTLDSAISV